MTEQNNPPTGETKTIPMDERTQRFYKGVAAGSKLTEAHAEVQFPDHDTRLACFYFYAGAIAAGEHGMTTNEEFEPFMQGLQTRAPQGSDQDRRVLAAIEHWPDDEFERQFGFERED